MNEFKLEGAYYSEEDHTLRIVFIAQSEEALKSPFVVVKIFMGDEGVSTPSEQTEGKTRKVHKFTLDPSTVKYTVKFWSSATSLAYTKKRWHTKQPVEVGKELVDLAYAMIYFTSDTVAVMLKALHESGQLPKPK